MNVIEVKELPARYGINRSGLYDRMAKIGVKPVKVAVRSFLNAEQLSLMDELNAFMLKGGAIAEFRELKGIGLDIAPVTTGISFLQYLHELEACYRYGWHITTTELEQLLNLTPSSISGRDRYSDAGFEFCKQGDRWAVQKPSTALTTQ